MAGRKKKKRIKTFTSKLIEFNFASNETTRGVRASLLQSKIDEITNKPGLYIWRYWPEVMPSLYNEDFSPKFYEHLKKIPKFKATVSNKKVMSKIEIGNFESKNEESLGMNLRKEEALLSYFQSTKNMESFSRIINGFLSFVDPIYIGKANDLQDRLKKHLNGETGLLDVINNDLKLNLTDIYITVMPIEDLGENPNPEVDFKKVLLCYEEIIQRIVHPILTKRYG